MAEYDLLVVEDEPLIAKDVCSSLEELGYSVLDTSKTGEGAIEMAGELEPDLVLMDIRLKGEIDGTEATHQIWEKFRLPVVYLTAHSDETTLEKAKSGGAYGYLTKPVEKHDLRNALEMAVNKHRMEEKLLEKERQIHKLELEKREKLAALGKMAGGITHDIKNLNAALQENLDFVYSAWKKIRNKLEELEVEDDVRDLVEQLPGTLDSMQRQIEGIKQIGDKTKTFSRADGFKSDKVVFNPVKKIKYFFEYLDDIFSNRDYDSIEFVLDLGSDLDVTLEGDPGEFSQVLKNLIENAAEAAIEEPEPEIRLRVFSKRSQFCITVRDNGPGISQADREKIFESFYSSSRAGENLGLGLSIVKGIVDKMGGEIEVDSEPGKWTKFRACFPTTNRS